MLYTSNASHRSRDALRGSFGSYRAIDVSIARENEQRKKRKLTLPVLAIGGGKAIGEGVANTMRLVRGERGEQDHPRQRALGRRGDAGAVASGAHAIPGAVPGCRSAVER